MAANDLDRFARHLFGLTDLLGISRAAVCEREEWHALSLSEAIELPRVAAEDGRAEDEAEGNGSAVGLHRHLVALAELGGAELSLDFTIPGSPFKLMSGAADLTVEEVGKLLATDEQVELSLALDKVKLAKRHVGHEAGFFLSRERLVAELNKPLSEWEARFAECPVGHKLVLLVALADVALAGDYLAVAGGTYLNVWTPGSASCPVVRAVATQTPAAATGDREPVASPEQKSPREDTRQVLPAEMAADVVDKVNWIDLHFVTLTPLHLAVEPSAEDYDPEGCPIAKALCSRWLDLCLTYAANQTRRNRQAASEGSDDWIATFGSDDSLARVRFGGAAMARGDVALPQSFRIGVAKVHEMVIWAYGGRRRDSDRLHVLQNVVAQHLHAQTEAEAYADVVRLAEKIESQKDWFWETYWEGKLNQYFDRVAKVMQFVDDVRKQYEGQIQQLTKSLVDSALAGVGVVVGTFIAALLKEEFNAPVFRAGILLYAAYLFFFPALLGLTHIWTRFRDERKTFTQRETLFRAHLYEKSVTDLLKPVTAAETRFWCWLGAAVFIYLAVCSLLVYGAFFGPAYLGLG